MEENTNRKKIIEIKNLRKIYKMGDESIKAVNDVSFDIYDGEFCCLLGTSGSGKSTLLNLMAGIEKATSGTILIRGKDVVKMNESQLARFRQNSEGFVFQSYNLIGTMTAVENVELPLVFKRVPKRKRRYMAEQMLKKVGLGDRMKHKPSEMSGGQQQRVGIARAFVSKPKIIFADEPTGNLDTRTTKEVMELITQMAHDNKQTIIMVTHDNSLAQYADRIIRISDGNVIGIEEPKHNEVKVPANVTENPEIQKTTGSGENPEATEAIETDRKDYIAGKEDLVNIKESTESETAADSDIAIDMAGAVDSADTEIKSDTVGADTGFTEDSTTGEVIESVADNSGEIVSDKAVGTDVSNMSEADIEITADNVPVQTGENTSGNVPKKTVEKTPEKNTKSDSIRKKPVGKVSGIKKLKRKWFR